MWFNTLLKTFQQAGFKAIKTHNRNCFINQFGYDGLNELIQTSSKNKKLFIIDSYRTPIERKISSFFSILINIIIKLKVAMN